MGDSEGCGGYDYLFGEADAITKKIEEYHRNCGRIDDSPVPVVSWERSSESCRNRSRIDDSPEPVVPCERSSESYISPMIKYQLQNQPTMSLPFNSISSEHYSSQDISHMIYYHEYQNRPTMCSTRHECQNQPTMCNIRQISFWKRLISILVPWVMRFFVPRRPRSRPILVPVAANPPLRSTSGGYEPRPAHSSTPETITCTITVLSKNI
ncbi:unnamed protein product [Arabis nemorensis]|uniref:Uncharacterized protein n=1 Tax=Arabis nemorensis TaxID=586526 RepID=A0A565C109_9BRAS|nr:unnamed protein product [Arabis nemorensis]